MNIQNKNVPTFDEQLAAHRPYLRDQIATYLSSVDLLSYVMDPSDEANGPKKGLPARLLADRERNEADAADAWTDAAKAINSGFVNRAVSTVEKAIDQDEPEEETKRALGSIILKGSEDIDNFESSEAHEAVDWVHGLFNSPKSIETYNKLFVAKEKAPRMTAKRKKAMLTPQVGDAASEIVVTIDKSIKNKPSITQEPIVIDRQPVVTRTENTIEEIKVARQNAREERRFATSLDRWVKEQVAAHPAAYEDVTNNLADLLDVSVNEARVAIDNTLARTKNVSVAGVTGSKSIATNEWIADRKEAAANAPEVEKKVPTVLTFEDRDQELVKSIVAEVADLQELTQGLESSAIAHNIKLKGGVEFDKKLLNSVIREICEGSNGTLTFEARGKGKRAKLYFNNPNAKSQFKDDPEEESYNLLVLALATAEERA